MASTGRAVGISPPPPAAAAVGIHPPAAVGISAPAPWASGAPPPPHQHPPQGAQVGRGETSVGLITPRRSSRSSGRSNRDKHGDHSNTNSNLRAPPPAMGRGGSSRLSSRLRKFNNPVQSAAPAPILKTEEYQEYSSGTSASSRARSNSSRDKTCSHEDEDGSACTRRPSFGLPGDRRASRCASHKLDGHVDITSRKCEFEGCSRIPSFRFHPTGSQEAKKGRVRFCAQHKQEGMQDYHQETRGCRFVAGAPGEEGQGVPCDRSSSFGFKGGKRTRCARHKEEGMINLNSPRCRGPECKLTPYFGKRGSTPAFCAKHKEAGMVNLISKRCEEEACDRIPSYNFDAVGAKAIYCNTHKAEGMINVRHPRCANPTCKRQPSFGMPPGEGNKRGNAVFCVEHKDPGMVDVKNNYRRKKLKSK